MPGGGGGRARVWVLERMNISRPGLGSGTKAQKLFGFTEALADGSPQSLLPTSYRPQASEGHVRWVSHRASRPPRGSWHSTALCSQPCAGPASCLLSNMASGGRGAGRGPIPMPHVGVLMPGESKDLPPMAHLGSRGLEELRER